MRIFLIMAFLLGIYHFPGIAESAKKQAEEQRAECYVNFGELVGFCGRYVGLISEERGSSEECNLLSQDDISLELDSERNLLLNLAPVNSVTITPAHQIGRLPLNPDSTIDVTSRTCGQLPGTALPSNKDNCKRLNMTGIFTNERGTRHFAGTYTIFDEVSKRICQYGLSLDRE